METIIAQKNNKSAHKNDKTANPKCATIGPGKRCKVKRKHLILIVATLCVYSLVLVVRGTIYLVSDGNGIHLRRIRDNIIGASWLGRFRMLGRFGSRDAVSA